MDKFNETIRKGPKAGLNIGASSILVIFIIVCLVTFSVLSLVSATADYRLCQKVAERNTSYYEATSRAQVRLMELARQSRSEAQLSEFDEPINEKQHIHVVVMFPADTSHEDISILSWQVEKNR